jgi:hypothetical protein
MRSNAAARLIFHVFDTGRIERPAMNTAQQTRLAKIVEILAHSLRRYIERARKIIDENLPLSAGDIQNCVVTRGKLHFVPGNGIILTTIS